jgi:hypothetical protein
MVWVVVWLGVSFVCVFVANIWPLLDPWRSLFELLQALVAGRKSRSAEAACAAPTLRWPAALGMWPAVALLLLWCWLEIVFPLASSPFKVGLALLAWTLLNLAGMWLFGRAVWQAHADVFALVFETLGRLAPLRLQPHQLIRHVSGQAAFIIALLATVIFDGLHGGATWFVFEGALGKLVQGRQDINDTLVGSAGLLCVWLLMLGAYALAVLLTLRLTSPLKLASLQTPIAAGTLAAQLAITLVPIAAAYLVAHNFSTMVTQGLAIVPLLSDPFGWQWNLLGTTRWTVDTSWLGAQLTWNVALLAIVLGHMVSVVWAHRVVLRAGVAPRRAAWGLLPMTLLMLAFTAMSLFLIAEPMVVSPP